ncbi:hypothetical protein Tco_0592569 [Tanacetum coccineum]
MVTLLSSGVKKGFKRSGEGEIRFTDGAEDGVAFWEEGAGIFVLEGAGFCKVGGFFDNRASIGAVASATNSSKRLLSYAETCLYALAAYTVSNGAGGHQLPLKVDCMMVVKEIENGLLEEVEVSLDGGLSKTLMIKERRLKKMKMMKMAVKYEN